MTFRSDSKLAISILGRCLATQQVDSKHEPLRDLLVDSGVHLVGVASNAADYYVAYEHSPRNLRTIRKAVPSSRRILIAVEPPSVHPNQYRRKVLGAYGQLFAVSESHFRSHTAMRLNNGFLPDQSTLQSLMKNQPPETDRPLFACLINSNKFSAHRKSLYWLRHDVIGECQRVGIPLHLAGEGWNNSLRTQAINQVKSMARQLTDPHDLTLATLRKPISLRPPITYHGKVEDSVSFQYQARFSIVIENEGNYVTEKLFNAVIAGTTPVYVGPKLELFGINPSIVIAVEANAQAVSRAILGTDADTRLRIRSEGRKWLSESLNTDNWTLKQQHRQIAMMIGETIRKSPLDKRSS